MAGFLGGSLGVLGGIKAKAVVAPKQPVFGNSNGMQGISGTTRNGQTPAQYAAAPAPVYQPAPVNYSNPGAVTNIPAPAPAPPRESYSMSDSNGRIAQVDNTFMDQESAYNTALDKVIANLGNRRKGLKRDAGTSRDGIAKNKTLGLTGLGEDFAARGLGHSGLYIDATEKANQAYTKQDDSVVNSLADQEQELTFSEEKERSDTASRIQSAKRDALYRLQMNNNLVTGI